MGSNRNGHATTENESLEVYDNIEVLLIPGGEYDGISKPPAEACFLSVDGDGLQGILFGQANRQLNFFGRTGSRKLEIGSDGLFRPVCFHGESNPSPARGRALDSGFLTRGHPPPRKSFSEI